MSKDTSVPELAVLLARREPAIGNLACAEWAVILSNLGRKATRNAERYCNGEVTPEQFEKTMRRIQATASKLAEPFRLRVETSGDPRGYCLHLFGIGTEIHGNTLGGDEAGYGI